MSPDLIRVDHRHHFIGDTHFGHVGILNMAARPYADIRARDRDLIDRWNAVVGEGHTVWHLGDFAGEDVPFDRAAEIFKKLNGEIRLIPGNHDGDEICSKLPWVSVDIMSTICRRRRSQGRALPPSTKGMERLPRWRPPLSRSHPRHPTVEQAQLGLRGRPPRLPATDL